MTHGSPRPAFLEGWPDFKSITSQGDGIAMALRVIFSEQFTVAASLGRDTLVPTIEVGSSINDGFVTGITTPEQGAAALLDALTVGIVSVREEDEPRCTEPMTPLPLGIVRPESQGGTADTATAFAEFRIVPGEWSAKPQASKSFAN